LDTSVKNLREWVVLLFCLFCVLDIAGAQYGMMLARDAPLQPNPVIGQIVSIVRGPRGAWYNVYVTERQLWIFQGLLAGAALSLLATLGLIVAHGVRRVRATRSVDDLRRRKR
jgi:CDP-diglyceride synthetase